MQTGESDGKKRKKPTEIHLNPFGQRTDEEKSAFDFGNVFIKILKKHTVFCTGIKKDPAGKSGKFWEKPEKKGARMYDFRRNDTERIKPLS